MTSSSEHNLNDMPATLEEADILLKFMQRHGAFQINGVVDPFDPSLVTVSYAANGKVVHYKCDLQTMTVEKVESVVKGDFPGWLERIKRDRGVR